MNETISIPVTVGPLNEGGGATPGPWTSCSFVPGGYAPDSRCWASIGTNQQVEFAITPDAGVTLTWIDLVSTTLEVRIPVPPGYGLIARHPGGGGAANRRALVAWSNR